MNEIKWPFQADTILKSFFFYEVRGFYVVVVLSLQKETAGWTVLAAPLPLSHVNTTTHSLVF